jgi:hypothetical protein
VNRDDPALARDEIVAAELLASRETVAELGILWETVDRLGRLQTRLAGQCVADHLTTLSNIGRATSATGAVAVLADHVDRRVRHLLTGLDQTVTVLSDQSQKTADAAVQVWAPFLAVLRRDWADPAPRPDGQGCGATRSHP